MTDQPDGWDELLDAWLPTHTEPTPVAWDPVDLADLLADGQLTPEQTAQLAIALPPIPDDGTDTIDLLEDLAEQQQPLPNSGFLANRPGMAGHRQPTSEAALWLVGEQHRLGGRGVTRRQLQDAWAQRYDEERPSKGEIGRFLQVGRALSDAHYAARSEAERQADSDTLHADVVAAAYKWLRWEETQLEPDTGRIARLLTLVLKGDKASRELHGLDAPVKQAVSMDVTSRSTVVHEHTLTGVAEQLATTVTSVLDQAQQRAVEFETAQRQQLTPPDPLAEFANTRVIDHQPDQA